MVQESQNLSMYMAIDADVLRDLTFIDYICEHAGKDTNVLNYVDDNALVFKNNYYYLKTLYEKVVVNPDSQFKLLVNETVWRETKFSDKCQDFVKKYCYVPRINIFNVTEKNDDAANLAAAYCFGYDNRETGVHVKPAMEPYHSKYGDKISRDARNMAEATRESAIFVTINAQDYVFDKHSYEGNKLRKLRIAEINDDCGYYKIINGKKMIPQPYPLHVIASLLKDKTNYSALEFILADDDNKVRASEEFLSM